MNKILIQVENSKDIAKWLLKNTSIALKQNIEPSKISKYFQFNFGLDETKSTIIKDLVIINIVRMNILMIIYVFTYFSGKNIGQI